MVKQTLLVSIQMFGDDVEVIYAKALVNQVIRDCEKKGLKVFSNMETWMEIKD